MRQLLALLLGFNFLLLAPGHVDHHADHAADVAGPLAARTSLGRDPAYVSIGQSDAVLRFERTPFRDCTVDVGAYPATILRHYGVREGLLRQFLCLIQAEHLPAGA